jgi:hypothetical protein
MPTATSLRPLDHTDWMNQGNGNWPVSPTFDDQTMHVPVKIDSQNSDSQETLNSAKVRRRASQGSLRTRPSPVSRFLSKSSVAVNFPSWEHRSSSSSRSESRTRSVDSRLRLSTTVSRGPRPLTRPLTASPSWNSPPAYQGEYPATLPPTPPEDDIPVAWNPKSEMLMFDVGPHHPGSMPMMDETTSVDNSSATGTSDTLSSPSDALSHRGSSSSGGSPGPRDEMDCQQDMGSWLDHGINMTGKLYRDMFRPINR